MEKVPRLSLEKEYNGRRYSLAPQTKKKCAERQQNYNYSQGFKCDLLRHEYKNACREGSTVLQWCSCSLIVPETRIHS